MLCRISVVGAIYVPYLNCLYRYFMNEGIYSRPLIEQLNSYCMVEVCYIHIYTNSSGQLDSLFG